MFNFILNNSDKTYSWVEISSALLTPAIAIFGGYIAYQQWKTSEKSRKQNLFDMRYEYIFKPILNICNKTINSIQDDKLTNIEELNELHCTKLSNIGKYSFLLKEGDLAKLLVHYGAIRDYVKDHDIHPVISKQDKDFMHLKLSRIYDMQRKYLSIEEEPYYNLWQLIGIVFVKFYKFMALNILVNKITKVFKRKKKKVYDATK